MPTIPVRGLAMGGIVRDQSPVSMPTPAWSNGRNVLFDNGKVRSAPIWRRVAAALSTTSSVRWCISRATASGTNEVIVARDDSSLIRVISGTAIDASQAGWVSKTSVDAPWTGGFLGDVLYVNRGDGVPRSMLPNATKFTALPNWPTDWRCRVLRPFQDALVALNVTTATGSYPSTVKVSEPALYGSVPVSWDSTDPTKLAYDSPLARLRGPILDGMALGDRFLIYSGQQVVEMRQNGNFLYGFEMLPFTDGVLNTNCVLEIDGLHYVFGSRDIYVTDGQTTKSLAEGRIKDALYRSLNTAYRNRAFVARLPTTNQVVFAYVSGDAETAWKSPTGCNAAWVYSRDNDTWAPIDLPNTTWITQADVSAILLYSTASGSTYETAGGSFFDQEGGGNTYAVGLSNDLNTPGSLKPIIGGGVLSAYDFLDTGNLALPVGNSHTAPAFVERIGIALDTPAEGQAPLVTDKLIRGIYPELEVSKAALTVAVSLDGTLLPTQRPGFASKTQFDPGNDYAVDQMAEGRFLAVRFDFPDGAETSLSGFDCDIVANGSR